MTNAADTLMTWTDDFGGEVEATSAEEAIKILRYEDEPGWWECSVTCVETGETASEVYYIEQKEPPCIRKAHRWDDPSAFGHGGGVYVNEVCAHCGCRRTTDTWAQCPIDGTQGHTITTYDVDDEMMGIMAERRVRVRLRW